MTNLGVSADTVR